MLRTPQLRLRDRAARGDPGGVPSTRVEQAVWFDSRTCNPVGRSRMSHRSTARLRLPGRGLRGFRGSWRLEAEGRRAPVATGRLGRRLRDTQVAAIRDIDLVRCDRVEPDDAAATAGLLAQLAGTGALVHVESLPEQVAALLSAEFAAELRAALPDELSDPVEWEIRSVRQRRAALRGHSAGHHRRVGDGTPKPPAVSVLLVTMRPRDVTRVVDSIARQTYPEVEIVIGLHGFALDANARRAVSSCGRPVEIVQVPEEANLGEALTMVTARASGDLVTKMDDDDVYGAEHIWDLVLAHDYSGATTVGKGAEFVYLETLGVTVRRTPMDRENFSTVVAGGTILLSRSDLTELGGWRPVPRGVDRSLLDDVERAGGLVYRAHPLGFIYCRHDQGHTWDPGLMYFLRSAGAQWPGRPPYDEFTPAGPS